MAQLSCSDLTLGFGDNILIKNLSFAIQEGDYLCIVGENGSGKSTLIRALLGLIQPESGSVRYGDGLKQKEIGYLPQQTVVQRDFPATVREIVLSGCQSRMGLRPFYGAAEKRRAAENMEKLGISELAKACYRNLSGGQQQRVLLARALCATEKLILLDEPVSGLDPLVTAEMYRMIEELNAEGITVIMISHDVEAAVRYASHILHIGETVFFGTKDEYAASELGRRYIHFEKVSRQAGAPGNTPPVSNIEENLEAGPQPEGTRAGRPVSNIETNVEMAGQEGGGR